MTFSDVIKNSVLENFQTGNLPTTTIIITLSMAVLMGGFVYLIYRINTHSGFYNRGFNKVLAILPVITATIIMAMGSNLAISLGMVGALSIVRFRNAVKDPVDLMFLFWSISAGIVIGAHLFKLSIIFSLVIAVLITLLDMIPVLKSPCLLVVTGKDIVVEDALIKNIKEQCKYVKVRSRNISIRGVEWIFELQARDEKKLVQNISALTEISSVHLMTHDGEMRL